MARAMMPVHLFIRAFSRGVNIEQKCYQKRGFVHIIPCYTFDFVR